MIDRRRFLQRLEQTAVALGLAGCCPSTTWGRQSKTRKHVPWLEETQTPPREPVKNAPKLSRLLKDGQGNRIDSVPGWEKRRAEIRKAWSEFLGELTFERPPVKLETVEEDRTDGVVRRRVRYESEPGIPVEGFLLFPIEQPSKPMPGVVVMHSTTKDTIRQPAGVAGAPEKAFGLQLAKRGFTAFCPPCFLWHDEAPYLEQVARFQKRRPGSKGMAKMLYDAVRAVDVLCGLPMVDPRRIGAVGHSLGAKEALYLAAFDDRVQATVSSEGGVGIDFSNWDAPWYLSPAARDPGFALAHHEVWAMAAPRPFLLIGGQSADDDRGWSYWQAAAEVYRLYEPSPAVGFWNHRQGHSVPEEAVRRIVEWFEVYLKAG